MASIVFNGKTLEILEDKDSISCIHPSQYIKSRKKILRGIRTGKKEIKLPFIVYDMIVNTENL